MSQGPLSVVTNQLLGSTTWSAGINGKQRERWVTQRHGKYYAAAYGTAGNGTVGFAANQSGVTLVALNATSYTGLAIQNPSTSTVNLVIQKVVGVGTVISAAMQTVALMYGHTTWTPGDSLSPYSPILGGAVTALKATVSANATLDGNAVLLTPLVATQIAAGSYSVREDIDGGIIVPPGYYMGFCDPVGTPTTSSFMGAIFWEEVAK